VKSLLLVGTTIRSKTVLIGTEPLINVTHWAPALTHLDFPSFEPLHTRT
jgi:hypothetical protein